MQTLFRGSNLPTPSALLRCQLFVQFAGIFAPILRLIAFLVFAVWAAELGFTVFLSVQVFLWLDVSCGHILERYPEGL